MRTMLEHPEIGWIERTGYPSWMQETDREDEEDDFEEPETVYED
jgi:hypothetical protein